MAPTAESPLRVAILSELPTPYRWPLFERVAALPELDVTVFFYTRTESDRDWGLEIERTTSPRVVFLEGRTFHVRGRRSLYFHWNPAATRMLDEGEFDVVVVPGWSMPTTLAALRNCRKRGRPYVLFSETNALSPRAGWYRALKRTAVRRIVGGAAAWLATGTMSARYLEDHGADPDRVFRFANTPDVEALRAAVGASRRNRDTTRKSLGVPLDAVMALFVGRLIGAKDPLTLARAHADLELNGAPHWTVIVGDGPEHETLRGLVDRRRIRHLVLAGSRRPESLPDIWAAADFFVLPSVHEPWGVVVNEAMAAGLPVLLSDRVGAAADLLTEDGNGHGFRAGDAGSLARAIRTLSDDPIRRRRMGRESEKIIAGWTYESSVEGFRAAVLTAAGVAV